MSAERCADMIQVPPQTVTLFFFEQREAMLLSTATSSEASYSFALLRRAPAAAAKAPNSVSCAQAACFRHSALKEAVAHRSEQRSVVCRDGGGGACFTSFVLCAAFTVQTTSVLTKTSV